MPFVCLFLDVSVIVCSSTELFAYVPLLWYRFAIHFIAVNSCFFSLGDVLD